MAQNLLKSELQSSRPVFSYLRAVLSPVALCILLLYLPPKALLLAQQGTTDGWQEEVDSLLKSHRIPNLDVISVGGEVITNAGGNFFDTYAALGGTVTTLGASLRPVFMARFVVSERLRALLYGTYLNTGFVDLYNAERESATGGADVPLAHLYEEASFEAVPVMVGVQFSPVLSQFTSYVGLTAGASFINTRWSSEMRQHYAREFYRPAINIDELGVVPVFRVFSGVDLRFDQYIYGGHPIRGIYIEAGYLYVPVTREFFGRIVDNGTGLAEPIEQKSGTVNLGGISFTLGINMQFLRLGEEKRNQQQSE